MILAQDKGRGYRLLRVLAETVNGIATPALVPANQDVAGRPLSFFVGRFGLQEGFLVAWKVCDQVMRC